MTKTLTTLLANDDGQGLAEYGVILGLVAVACVSAVVFLSGKVQGILSSVGSSV